MTVVGDDLNIVTDRQDITDISYINANETPFEVDEKAGLHDHMSAKRAFRGTGQKKIKNPQRLSLLTKYSATNGKTG